MSSNVFRQAFALVRIAYHLNCSSVLARIDRPKLSCRCRQTTYKCVRVNPQLTTSIEYMYC